MNTLCYVFIRFLYRYEQHLRTVKMNGIRKGAITGVFLGFLFLVIFCAYGLVRITSFFSIFLLSDRYDCVGLLVWSEACS